MKPRQIRDGVQLIGAIDWNRRLFDSLIPLPDGTSYNAYLVRGSEKTVLMDTVDPGFADILMQQLDEVESLDYVVSHHTEQDHSGTIPKVLDKYPQVRLVCTPKAQGMLADHLGIPEDRILAVADGDSISLGDRTLKFLHTPWVHWPETMVTYLPEEQILFSCDFFGSHLATTDIYAGRSPYVYEAAKRYYAEIMMPFKKKIQDNVDKVATNDISLIAPSHGPIYDEPGFIIDAYRDWVSDRVDNLAVVAYVSMHGSTAAMVDHMVSGLAERGVAVNEFDLAVTDIGKLAISLVDAATLVLGAPTVHFGPHPLALYAAHLVGALKPKLRYAAVIGSFGWATKAADDIEDILSKLKVELVGKHLCKGFPADEDFEALDDIAAAISTKHALLGEDSTPGEAEG